HHGVAFQAGPVIRPLLHIEHHGIVLGHIELTQAPDLALPRNFDIRSPQGAGHGGRYGDKLASIDFHYESPLRAWWGRRCRLPLNAFSASEGEADGQLDLPRKVGLAVIPYQLSEVRRRIGGGR